MSATRPFRVLGIAGSLRKDSFNAKLLRQAIAVAPPGLAIEAFPIADIPMYDEDVRVQGFPAPVQALREAIKAADGLLFVTPEYNHSIPGVLKNAIDWASRPPEQPFDGKPVSVMSAAPGAFGGVRAQGHLRQVLAVLNCLQMNRPEVIVAQAGQKFAADGSFTDEAGLKLIRDHLANLEAWIARVAAG